jgi:hypothetical protein
MRHIIHCSGYSLAENQRFHGVVNRQGEPVQGKYFDWDYVCLGDPTRARLGRISMTLRLAAILKAECIIWSTGATYLEGVSEAEVMMNTALSLGEQTGLSAPLKVISILEQKSKDTFGSMEAAAEILEARFGGQEIMLHLVSSANHVPRLAREATITVGSQPNTFISVVPAHTSYGGGLPCHVTIREFSSVEVPTFGQKQ